jgi:hypothetical protein
MPKSRTIGYCVIELVKDSALEVGCWTEQDSAENNIEPSNFFPEKEDAMQAVIDRLNRNLIIERHALALACDRIHDGPQTYEEANTIEGWMDEYREQAKAGEIPVYYKETGNPVPVLQ